MYPFFLVFYLTIGDGEYRHQAYREQGHIYGFPTKQACNKAMNREVGLLIHEGLIPNVQFGFICMQDVAEAYSGGGEYIEEWDKHRWDGWA